jgi:hypothetical protein
MAGVVLLIVTILFVAPLVLGSYIVAQRASRETLTLWLGFLTSLFLAALVFGGIALLTMPV